MKNSTCHCGNTSPEIRHEARMITFAGNEYPVVEEYYYCKNCSHEWVSPAQLKESLAQVTAIKRRAQGFLAPQDIKDLRERHGLTQKQAAIIFGGGDNAFSKYERGEIYPSAAMDKLMRIFDTIPEVKNYLVKESKPSMQGKDNILRERREEYLTLLVVKESNNSRVQLDTPHIEYKVALEYKVA